MHWCEVVTACSVAVGALSSLTGCVTSDGLRPLDPSRVTLLQMEPLLEGEDIAVVSTDSGQFRLRFFPSEAPLAVENFQSLAREGAFDGTSLLSAPLSEEYERKVLCGGCSLSRVCDGKPFKKEISANLWHFPGAVSVLSGRTGKGSGRFFITGSAPVDEETLADLAEQNYPPDVIHAFRSLGGAPEYSLEYSIFAQVVEGLEVVDGLLSGKKPVLIQSVSIVVYDPSAG